MSRGFLLETKAPAVHEGQCPKVLQGRSQTRRIRIPAVSEQQIQQQIRLACSRGPTRLWRNNVGRLLDQSGRPVAFGLCPGSADLVGFTTVTITPDMVGQQVAVFAAVEVKAPAGRPTPQQTAWLEHVSAAGGLAGIARSVEEAQAILSVKSDANRPLAQRASGLR
jgi:hypothetical protein